MPHNRSITAPLKFEDQVRAWGLWMEQRRSELPGHGSRAHLISVTYGRYRNRYYKPEAYGGSPPPQAEPITKSDVYAGLTRKMGERDTARLYVGDVNRWYLKMLNAVYGGKASTCQSIHPIGVGWIDRPAVKRMNIFRRGQALPGDDFPNAHFVLLVPDAITPDGQENAVDRFHRLWQSGEFGKLWAKCSPGGDMQIDYAHTIDGGVDYAAKTAKQDRILQEEMIVLPFGRTVGAVLASGVS